MTDEPNEGFDFNPEEFEKKVLEVIDPILLKQQYDETKIHHLQNLICEKVMKMLIDLNLNCKFLSNLESPSQLHPDPEEGNRICQCYSQLLGSRTRLGHQSPMAKGNEEPASDQNDALHCHNSCHLVLKTTELE